MNQSEDALGNVSTYTYDDDNGNLLSFEDPLNNITSYSYDDLNRLVEVTDPLLNSSYYDYNSVSYLTTTRDPRSSSDTDNTYRTLLVPNELNILDTLTDQLSKDTSYLYDRSRNLTNVTLPNGLEVNYEYDNANRLTRKALDGGKYFTYAYRSGTNYLQRVTDQSNKKYDFSYDRAGRIIYTKDNFNVSLNYAYDRSNNLTAISGGNSVQYGYNNNNTLSSISFGDLNINYHYDESGRVFNISYPENNYRYLSYLPNGWCYRIQDTAFPGKYRFDYSYDNNGNISDIKSWAGDESFTYDENSRLLTWDLTPRAGSGVPSASESYDYDDAGNLTAKGSQDFNCNNANQITNTGFEYDYNGNLTRDGTYIYSYNAENRLTEVRRVSDNSVVATYSYNYDGLRKSKTVNGQTTNFQWDAFGNLVRESNSSGEIAQYYYDTGGKIVGLKKNNQYYTTHSNLRGDVVSVTDSVYTVAQYHYDPWGNQIFYSGTLSQPIQYAGYYYDEETGLYYLKNRYYSPALGRFLTKDSIKYIDIRYPDTLNGYTYVYNNPLNYVDPIGHFVIAIPAGLAVAAKAAVIAGLATAAAGATAHLVKEISNRFHSDDSQSSDNKTTETPNTFSDDLKDIAENPSDWEQTGRSVVESLNRNNRGGKSIEDEFTNKKTGRKIYQHTLETPEGGLYETPHYRPYPKQIIR
jgi:RHS repeat-associated protein